MVWPLKRLKWLRENDYDNWHRTPNPESISHFRYMIQSYIDNIKDKYLDDRLSDDEIEIIKSQLLDLSDPSDLEFAKELESMIRQKSYGF